MQHKASNAHIHLPHIDDAVLIFLLPITPAPPRPQHPTHISTYPTHSIIWLFSSFVCLSHHQLPPNHRLESFCLVLSNFSISPFHTLCSCSPSTRSKLTVPTSIASSKFYFVSCFNLSLIPPSPMPSIVGTHIHPVLILDMPKLM